MSHLPTTYAYPVRDDEEDWGECDGCCDDTHHDDLTEYKGWTLCPGCLAFWRQRTATPAKNPKP